MRKMISTMLAGLLLLGAGPAVTAQQVRTIDPNQAVDADLSARAPQQRPPSDSVPLDEAPAYPDYTPPNGQAVVPPVTEQTQEAVRADAEAAAATGKTFQREELLNAAEGTFGKGTAGLAGLLEKVLREQGEPNAYIAGREASGAVVIGLRYGKGELFHKVEGKQPVYWTGPSVGFDLGGDANKVFVLVYNLYDSEDLYRRFPAGEGRLYFVGGVSATYLRRGNIVVIPIRLGVGWRQGANVGYMKFSHKSKWMPF